LEVPGIDHLWYVGDVDPIIDAIVHFAAVGWVRPADQAERRLATVLFTDIVGSTQLAAKIGDHAWRDVLQKFHAIGDRQLEVHRDARSIPRAMDCLRRLTGLRGQSAALRLSRTRPRR